MTRKLLCVETALLITIAVLLSACGEKVSAKADSADTAPPAAQVESDMDPSNFKVDRPGDFPTVTAGSHLAASELTSPGVISADVSLQRPVISTATGRVLEVMARVGDSVKQGQVIYRVRSAEITSAFSDYQKALVAEQLTKKQLDRAQILVKDGAYAASQLEIAQSALDAAQVDVKTAATHLQQLGADPAHQSDIVEMSAPVSGVITDQQVTAGAAVQAYSSSPNPITISDMSHVWIIVDVFENQLSQVHLGEYADVRLNAYPDRVFRGRIGNIGQIMDPNLHTAKVRLELENPNGLMRLGMFVTATFHGDQGQLHAAVPASAILHLHDRDWVYAPAPNNHFKRIEVVSGPTLRNNMQEVVSGIKPGDKVVADALVLQSTVEQ